MMPAATRHGLRRYGAIAGWLTSLALLAVFVLVRAAALIADGFDNGCVETEDLKPAIELQLTGKTNPVPFDTSDRCADTGIHLQSGETYKIALDSTALEEWKDGTIPAGPDGIDNWRDYFGHPILIAGLPLRRHLSDNWFVLMGKIGRNGSSFRVGESRTIRANATGRLYLYVNDAIWPFCGRSFFYDNNTGTAGVTVTRHSE